MMPVGGVGIVPLLIEVAAQMEAGSVNQYEIIERSPLDPVEVGGVWQHLLAPALPLRDLAQLASSVGDALASNALLARVGLDAVRARIESLGLSHTSLMDRFRDHRGPDDAPWAALSSARDLADVMRSLVNSDSVSPAVSAQVAEWLSRNADLSLAAVATGLDPFAHEADRHGLLFLNKTGREGGVRAEAGVLAGPRAGVAYSLIACFDDDTVRRRLFVHEAFRTFGNDLMEFVH